MKFSSCTVIGNQPLSSGYYLLTVEYEQPVRMGQFYMLRAWEDYPFLSRPFSVFDAEEGSISFVYHVVGKGTAIFSGLKPGGSINIFGPLGNGFPDVQGIVALVGGGAGNAPFYLAAKQIKAANPDCRVDAFLGFSGEPFLTKQFESIADSVVVNSGGLITDEIDPSGYDHLLSCGPATMMKALYEKCKSVGKGGNLYVSLESRMACGVGACFVCSCSIDGSNKKACKEGPVFPAEKVFG